MGLHPRYFVPHTATAGPDGVTELGIAHEAALNNAVDAFVLGGPRGLKRVVVVRDLAGELFLVEEEHVGEAVRRTLVTHEMAKGGKARFLDVEELWLFAVELLEQAADTPGENDPVALYGRLTGPWPTAGSASAVNGQLTVTRGDLMRGFVDGEPFLVDGGAVFHACVPGGPPDDTKHGKAVVLCYPLLPVDAGGAGGGNEACALQVVSSLAQALHDDMMKLPSRNAFTQMALPCVDRKSTEARLEAEGFSIRGDVAERKTGLLSVERKQIPREWSTSDIVPVGKAALAALKGFPDQRSQLLWQRIRAEAPLSFAPPSQGSGTPRPPTPTAAPPKAREQPFRRTAPDWMQDFDASGAPPVSANKPRPQPQAQPPAPPRKTSVSTKSKPDWMKDFE